MYKPKNTYIMRCIPTLFSILFCLSMQAQLVTYPESLNPGMPHNDDYTVRVRNFGAECRTQLAVHGLPAFTETMGRIYSNQEIIP